MYVGMLKVYHCVQFSYELIRSYYRIVHSGVWRALFLAQHYSTTMGSSVVAYRRR